MSEDEMAALALRAISKKWDFETLKYGDDLYGKEYLAEDVWEYVEQCESIGTEAYIARHGL